jgi:hypothetical protein
LTQESGVSQNEPTAPEGAREVASIAYRDDWPQDQSAVFVWLILYM